MRATARQTRTIYVVCPRCREVLYTIVEEAESDMPAIRTGSGPCRACEDKAR